MHYFERIGGRISAAWKAKDYDEDALAEIAHRVLSEEPAHQEVTAWDPLKWVQEAGSLPQQLDYPGRFGEPPITLYRCGDLVIDVYYWLDGTTQVHQHKFSGAFQVVSGSSIHARYDFERSERIHAGLLLGSVRLQEAELLGVGATRAIVSGDRFIHALFHLDRPSVTLVARNISQADASPQFSYLKPHLAIDPDQPSVLAGRRLQTLRVLRQFAPEDYLASVREICQAGDFGAFVSVLRDYAASGETMAKVDELLALARKRHGGRVGLLRPVLEEERRQMSIVSRRRHIHGPEHRFFLALLANCPNGQVLLNLVKERYPASDPVKQVTEWVRELSLAPSALGAADGNALGLPLDEEALLILSHFLRERSAERVERRLLDEGYDAADLRSSLEDFVACMKGSSLMGVLFAS